MIYLRLALCQKLLRLIDGSIHFCACLKFSMVIYLKTVYFLLKQSLLQQHNSKASLLQCSAFFMVQLSHPYITTGKTIVFEYMVCHIWFEYMVCWQSDVSTFQYAVCVYHRFPRSKHFLISWLQSPSAVIFEPKEIKPVTASTIRHWHSKIFKAKQKLTLNWLSHKQHPDLNSL